LQFQKRSQRSIGAHDEPLSVALRTYEVRPRKDHRGVDLISDVLPLGRLWDDGPNAVADAIGYAEHRSRSHDAAIRVYDAARQRGRNARAQGEFKEGERYRMKQKAGMQ